MFSKMFFITTNLMTVANAIFTNQTFQQSCSGYKMIENGTFESSYDYQFPFYVMGTDELFNMSFEQSYPLTYFQSNETFEDQYFDLFVSYEFDDMNTTILGLNLSLVYSYDDVYSMNLSFQFPDVKEENVEFRPNGIFGMAVTMYVASLILFR
jgi:hypothetical protein